MSVGLCDYLVYGEEAEVEASMLLLHEYEPVTPRLQHKYQPVLNITQVLMSAKVHKHENFFDSDFEFLTFYTHNYYFQEIFYWGQYWGSCDHSHCRICLVKFAKI